MNAEIRAKLSGLLDWIDALELRERLLILGAAVVVLYLLVDSFGLQPTLKAQQVIGQQTSALEMKLSALRDQANLLSVRSTDDSLRTLEETRNNLGVELARLDDGIVGKLGALVEPAQAANVLEQVVSRHRGLKMKSLQAQSEPLEQLDAGQQQLAGLGRYQLDFELEGGYLDLLRYLQALESMPWKFFWQKVNFQVQEYPRAITRLQLYTLGAARNG